MDEQSEPYQPDQAEKKFISENALRLSNKAIALSLSQLTGKLITSAMVKVIREQLGFPPRPRQRPREGPPQPRYVPRPPKPPKPEKVRKYKIKEKLPDDQPIHDPWLEN